MTLSSKHCVPCEGGLPPLVRDMATEMLNEIPGWQLLDSPDRILRRFTFDNFVKAMDFAQKVGELAETEGHHPDIGIGWGYCSVEFYTHKIKGLHENDFIMAARVNELYEAKKS